MLRRKKYGRGYITTLPKNENIKLLITTAAHQIITDKTATVAMRIEMYRLAKLLLGNNTGPAVYGVGEVTVAQFMVKLGDVRHYPQHSSLVTFAGLDLAVDLSRKHDAQSNATTKRSSLHL